MISKTHKVLALMKFIFHSGGDRPQGNKKINTTLLGSVIGATGLASDSGLRAMALESPSPGWNPRLTPC